MTATTVPGRNPGVLQSLFRLGNFDAWFLDLTAAATGVEDSATGEPRLALNVAVFNWSDFGPYRDQLQARR